MHEVQFLYLCGQTTRGLMLTFFCLQVPLIWAERWLSAQLR